MFTAANSINCQGKTHSLCLVLISSSPPSSSSPPPPLPNPLSTATLALISSSPQPPSLSTETLALISSSPQPPSLSTETLALISSSPQPPSLSTETLCSARLFPLFSFSVVSRSPTHAAILFFIVHSHLKQCYYSLCLHLNITRKTLSAAADCNTEPCCIQLYTQRNVLYTYISRSKRDCMRDVIITTASWHLKTHLTLRGMTCENTSEYNILKRIISTMAIYTFKHFILNVAAQTHCFFNYT